MREPLIAVLGCLAYAREPLCLRAIISIVTALSAPPTVAPDTFQWIARKLSSLVMGTEDLDTPLVAFHTSFIDFLQDMKRSQSYFVNPSEFHHLLATRCLFLMEASLHFNICNVPTSFKPNTEIENIQELIHEHIPDALSYACRFWTYHLWQLGAWSELEGFRKSVTALLSDRVLEWLEVMSLTASVPIDSLRYLESIEQVTYASFTLLLLVLMTPSRFRRTTPTLQISFMKHPSLRHFLLHRL